VVIVGNNDLSMFSGYAQTDDRYQAMVKKIHDDTLRAGKIFGQANAIYAKDHPLSNTAKFFQNGPSNDGWQPPPPAAAALSTPAPAPRRALGPRHLLSLQIERQRRSATAARDASLPT